MKGSNESTNKLSIDQIYAGIQSKKDLLNSNDTLGNTQSQNPPQVEPKFYPLQSGTQLKKDPLSSSNNLQKSENKTLPQAKPKFNPEPKSNIKTKGAKKKENYPANVANVNYQVSIVKASVFIILALVPIIWIGVTMGTCSTKYKNTQICSSQYLSSYALSESECCDPYKIIFGIWLGSFLAYILENILVLMIRPPSLSNFFTGILLFQKTGQGESCFSKSCSAILLLLFWPIITVVAIISGIIYLLTLCCEEKQPQQN